MDSALDVADDDGDPVQCWCCGQRHPAGRMVTLGNHPEVALCLRCAHFVHKQAWEIEDGGRSGPLVLSRSALRRLRHEVIRRGWQHNRLIGGGLRWLGRRVP